MSYYQGDYYQGDYYQGDPFLGALIGMGATWLGKKLLGKGASKALVASTGAGAMVGAGSGIVAGAVGTEVSFRDWMGGPRVLAWGRAASTAHRHSPRLVHGPRRSP